MVPNEMQCGDGLGWVVRLPGDAPVLGRALAEGVDALAVHDRLLVLPGAGAALLARRGRLADVLAAGTDAGVCVCSRLLHGDAAGLGPGAHGQRQRVYVPTVVVVAGRHDGVLAVAGVHVVDVSGTRHPAGRFHRGRRSCSLLVQQRRVGVVVHVVATGARHHGVGQLVLAASRGTVVVPAVAVAAVVVAGVVQAQRHGGTRAEEVLELRRRRHLRPCTDRKPNQET
jgi:hypothetical protein